MLKDLYYALGAGWAQVNRHWTPGFNIYNSDWDICIVLDSARADDFAELAPESWTVKSKRSVGSVTTEWLTNTFNRKHQSHIKNTTLVSASPHTQTVFDDRHWLTDQSASPISYPNNPAVDKHDFAAVYELWQSHAGNDGVVPPETMRDATAAAYEKHDGRVVAHWMQPHEPFIASEAKLTGGTALDKNVWSGLSNGSLDLETVRQSYRANLKYAIDCVAEMLELVDATVMVTADHGNAFGKYGIYGHPFMWPERAVRSVPWVKLDAKKTKSTNGEGILDCCDPDETQRKAQLEALGYC